MTESIKTWCIAKRIQNANGDFTFPANVNITGRLNLLPHGTTVRGLIHHQLDGGMYWSTCFWLWSCTRFMG